MATKNIVPNDNGEGGIGVTGKRWNTGFINTITGNLTGNVTGNASGTAATVTGAAQSNITSLGTLTGLNIGNDAAANLVFTPSANDTITLAAAANGAFTITTVDTAAAAANVGFVVDGNFTVSNVTSTITSSSSDITTFATTNATSGYTEFAYNTSTVAGYIGNGTSLLSGAANTDFIMRSESGAIKFTTGGGNLALTIDSSQNATFAGKSDITTSVSGFASTITNNKDDSQGVLIRTSDNDGGEYILDLQSSSSATGTDYASKFNVAKSGNVGIGSAPITSPNSADVSLSVFAAQDSSIILGDSVETWEIYQNDDLFFSYGSSPTTVMLLHRTSNNVTIAGDLIIGTSGKGIDFSATSDGSGTTSSEVLDDYEEGTYTPDFVASINVSGTPRGFYTLIGNIVTVHVTITSAGSISDGNAVSITLPFVTASLTGGAYNGGGSIGYTTLSLDNLVIGRSNGVNQAAVLKNYGTQVTHTEFSGKRIDFTIVYQIA